MGNGKLKVENGKSKMEFKENNIVMNKSYAFALRIIKLYKYLISDHKEYVLSKQILRCGTSIGALVKEAEHAQSKPDFINKMNVALKEANETEYWLMLLKDSNFIVEKSFISIQNDCIELIRLLASIVKSSKATLKK
jgi:four helix bundle protein